MYLGVLAGVLKQKLLRALPRAQQFLRFTLWGPWAPAMGPHGGIGGVLVIGYWLLVIGYCRFQRFGLRDQFHRFGSIRFRLLGSLLEPFIPFNSILYNAF